MDSSNILKVQRESFFEGIQTILCAIEQKSFFVDKQQKASMNEIKISGPKPDKRVLLTYESHTGHNIEKNITIDDFIPFFEARKAIEPLRITFPYLDYFVKRIEETIKITNGVLTERDILIYLVEYLRDKIDNKQK